MNSRERLLDIVADIGTGPDDGALVDINAEDAAALRELDQLLLDLISINNRMINDKRGVISSHMGMLEDLSARAAQAGYGDK